MCRVGLVYDLKSDYLAAGFSPTAVMEFDDEATVAGLEAALGHAGCTVERVGRGVELARRLAAGERWDLVFTIAEGVSGRSREAQVPALCELFDQPCAFSDPLTCAVTLDKVVAKRLVRDSGLPTAPFAVVRRLADVGSIALEPPLFVKPAAEGSSKGITGASLVTDRAQLESACAALLGEHGQPVLVERFLPGREVTVGVLGNGDARAIGVMEVAFTEEAESPAYTALNKDEYLRRVAYRLVTEPELREEAEALALGVYAALDCRDAARIDLRQDEVGRLNFMEANPLAGLHPVRSDLPILAGLAGMSYETLIAAIVDEARRRCPA